MYFYDEELIARLIHFFFLQFLLMYSLEKKQIYRFFRSRAEFNNVFVLDGST